MRRFLLYCFFVMFCFSVFSQQNFSEKALMGRGDLVLEGTSYKLQKETLQAFKEMKKSALKEGIDIKIVSGYRSFNRQKNIWNRKYNLYISQGLAPDKALQKIIEYSTIPGTSRHHWGTDFDIIDGSVKAPKSLLIESNYEKNGVYAKLKKWMDAHAESFGFYLVYTNISSRKGFKYEPWHYTYKTLSDQMLLEFRKINLIEFYKNVELNGSQYLTKEFLKKYTSENILDINIDLIKN